MAQFSTHLAIGTLLGAGYGFAGANAYGIDTDHAVVAGGLTLLGAILPDFDSDHNGFVSELFGLAGAIVPLLLLQRMFDYGLTMQQVLIASAILYLLIRYCASYVFFHFTVHRGMLHSIPALAIAGLIVYALNNHEEAFTRHYMALSVMVGYLSHLILDHFTEVNFAGSAVKLNGLAGSALKLYSPSWKANLITYGLFLVTGRSYVMSPSGVPMPTDGPQGNPPTANVQRQPTRQPSVNADAPVVPPPQPLPEVRQVIQPASLQKNR